MIKPPRSIRFTLRTGLIVAFSGMVVSGRAADPVPDFPPGHCVVEGKIDKRLPSVVITHGWRFRNRDFHAPPETISQLGQEIGNRLGIGESPGRRANIVYYVWPEASRPLYHGFWQVPEVVSACRHAGNSTLGEGERLARELRRILGETYREPVHFIGHSFGALVNAHAIRALADDSGWRCDVQFTMLDAAIRLTLLSQDGVKKLLPKTGRVRVLRVDNYIGAPLASVGSRLAGAGPDSLFGGGMRLARNHCGVIAYYRETIRDKGKRAGFQDSIILTKSAPIR